MVTLALRATLEGGVVGALAYWGYRTGSVPAQKIALAVAAPVVGFGIWGAVDFRWAKRRAEWLRLGEELVLSGLAALALYGTGARALGLGLGLLSVVYHALVYLLGGRLLQPVAAGRGRRAAPEAHASE